MNKSDITLARQYLNTVNPKSNSTAIAQNTIAGN